MKIEHSQEWLDGYKAALETVKMYEEKLVKDFQTHVDNARTESGKELAKAHVESHETSIGIIDGLLRVNHCDQLLKSMEVE